MHDQIDLEPFARALLLRGLPHAYARRTVREIAAHLEDLREEGLARGLSRDEASMFARRQFGDLECLAEELADRRRRTYWLGRHRFAGFVLLPIVAFSLGLLLCLFLAAVLGGWLGFWHPGGLRSAETGIVIESGLRWIKLGLLACVSWFFYFKARRSGCSLWVCGATTLALAVHGLVHHVTVIMPAGMRPGQVVWGYGIHFDPLDLLLSALILGAFMLREKRAFIRTRIG
jgi:hypothetical protein